MKRDTAVALAQTAASACLWGTSFPVIAFALGQGLSPFTLVFLRFAIAAPIMILASLAMKKRLWVLLKDTGVWVVSFFNALGFMSQYIGQQYTGAGVAALLVNLSVIFAAIGGVVFLGERLGTYRASGVAIAFAGTMLVTTNGNLLYLSEAQLTGIAFYMVAAVSWAGYIVYAKEKGDQSHWDPTGVAACIVALTALFFAPALLLAAGPLSLSAASWWAIGFTAVINTTLPFMLYQAGLRRLTATTSAVVLMLEVVVALLISAAFLGERLGTVSILGAVAILASILLVSGVEVSGKSLSVGQTDVSRVKVLR